MTFRKANGFLLVGAFVTLAGCATIDPRQDRGAIEGLLSTRGAASLPWDQNGLPTTDDAVHALLEKPLDRETAIRIAMLKSPRLQQVYGELGLARADVLDAVQIGNPQVSASSLALAGGPGSQFVIGIAQPLVDLLTLPAKAKLARIDYQRARYATAAAILGVTLDVEAAWYRNISATQVADMRAAVAESLQASADLAQRFYDAGNITAIQLNREKAAASEANIAAARAKVGARLARLELNVLLGLSGSDADWAGPSALPLPLEKEDDPGLLVQTATANSLDLLAAREGVRVASGAKGVAQVFGLLGSSTIGYDREREVDRSVIRGPTINLEIPIFNQQGAKRSRALGELQLARAKLATLDLQLTNGVPLAAERVKVLSEIVGIYRTALVPEREVIANNSQLEENWALIGQFEVLLARSQQFEAYQGFLEAIRDYWLARIDLARLIGSRLPSDAVTTKDAPSPADYLTPPASPATGGHQHHGGSGAPASGGHEGHTAPETPMPSGHEGHQQAPEAPPTPTGHEGHQQAPATPPTPTGHQHSAPPPDNPEPAPPGHEHQKEPQ